MPLKQFKPPPQEKPPGMSEEAWQEHLEEVKAHHKRVYRQSGGRLDLSRSQGFRVGATATPSTSITPGPFGTCSPGKEESRMPAKGPGQYAPCSDDPDPPPKPMSDEERKAFGEAARKLLNKKRAEDGLPPLPPPGPPKGRLIYHGSVPDTDPRYSSGWNFLSGKNLNQPSNEKSPNEAPETERKPAPQSPRKPR
jgi:hypothetical protein